jgi:hypothetical protein
VVSNKNTTKMLPKEGNKKWKGREKNTIAITRQSKDPNNQYNHCNIDGHNENKYGSCIQS